MFRFASYRFPRRRSAVREDRFLIENKLWMITAPIGVPIYYFRFRDYFDCRTPYSLDRTLPGVARVGAFADYAKFFHEAQESGIALLNTPEEQERASTLTGWYPRISELTPRSCWFSEIPSFDELADDFGLPFFIKGARQTSRHRATASVVKNREDYDRVVKIFRVDDVLRWQTFVCRQWLPLRRVAGDTGDKMPPSYEFRTFWRRGTLLAAGRYWYDVPSYAWSDQERDAALALAASAAVRVDCGFLVIDLAMTAEGRWIVIECNDAMESGYAGASPFALWQGLLDRL